MPRADRAPANQKRRPWPNAPVRSGRVAHAAGLAVVPYGVDDAPTMRHLVRRGVDGLITNHPERLRDVLAGEGRNLPPACPGTGNHSPVWRVPST